MELKQLLKRQLPTPLLWPLRFCGSLVSKTAQAWHAVFGTRYCPLCETKVGEFDPLPQFFFDQWQNHGFAVDQFPTETCNLMHYSCPRCHASDRERLYALFLRERLAEVPASFKLVDFAPSGALNNWIKRKFNIQYRTADLFMQGVDDCVDLTDMAIYPTGSMDAFICSHMLEHIRDDAKALSELFRILKPGGWGILMVPIALGLPEIREDPAQAITEADRWRHFGQDDHIRIYNREGFLSRASSAGFRMVPLPVTRFGGVLAEKCGFTATSVLYVAERPVVANH